MQRLEWGGNAPFCGRAMLPAEDQQEYWAADRTIDLLEKNAGIGKPFMIFSSFLLWAALPLRGARAL